MIGHIAFLNEIKLAWCGKSLQTDFHFKNIEHAVLGQLHGGKYELCPECVDFLCKALTNENKKT